MDIEIIYWKTDRVIQVKNKVTIIATIQSSARTGDHYGEFWFELPKAKGRSEVILHGVIAKKKVVCTINTETGTKDDILEKLPPISLTVQK